MKRTTSIALIGVSLLSFGTIAYAQQATTAPSEAGARAPIDRAELQRRLGARFDAADTNRDGVLTVEERTANRAANRAKRAEARTKMRDEQFTRLDTDKNGSLSREEFSAGRGAMRGPGRGRGEWAARTDGADRSKRTNRGDRPDRSERAERGERDGRHGRGGEHRRHGGGFGPGFAGSLGGGMMMHGALAQYENKPLPRAVFVDAGVAGFDRIDTDHDGKISAAERDAARKAMIERRNTIPRPTSPTKGG